MAWVLRRESQSSNSNYKVGKLKIMPNWVQILISPLANLSHSLSICLNCGIPDKCDRINVLRVCYEGGSRAFFIISALVRLLLLLPPNQSSFQIFKVFIPSYAVHHRTRLYILARIIKKLRTQNKNTFRIFECNY